MLIDLVRWLHVIGATVLLGTGAGIAFFMLMAHRTADPRLIAHTGQTVVLADAIFTLSAVIAQPATGISLAHMLGWSLGEGWLVVSLGLYVLTGLFWIPVVLIQMKLRDLACEAMRDGMPLGAAYHRLFRIWFACGIPAFLAVLAIVWLMVTKPVLELW